LAKRAIDTEKEDVDLFKILYKHIGVHTQCDRTKHFHDFAVQITKKYSALVCDDSVVVRNAFSTFDFNADYQYIYFKDLFDKSVDRNRDVAQQAIVFASLYLISFRPSRIQQVITMHYNGKMPFATTSDDIVTWWKNLTSVRPYGTGRFQPRSESEAMRLAASLPKLLPSLTKIITSSSSRKEVSTSLTKINGFGSLSVAHLTNLISTTDDYAWVTDEYSILGPGSLFALNHLFQEENITQGSLLSRPLSHHQLELLLCEYQKYITELAKEEGLVQKSNKKYFNVQTELDVPDKENILERSKGVMKLWLHE